ncbi:hypothetical protein [Sporosarcina obsidiansis]|uniref:hypothetical protein n=1 Tax=Sporosarcina obsidiansis TaxID=2660748 RepID=UPI00129C0FCD|nr:hypothetical protein [Sporosarcina obsidiansis]
MKHLLKIEFIIIGVFGFLLIPVLVNLLFLSWGTTITNGETNSWIGFFGSYIGSTIGGLLTLVGVIMTLNSRKKDSEKEQKTELKKLILLMKEEISENLKLIKKLDNFPWSESREKNVFLGKENILDILMWRQMKSDSLLLLDIDILKCLAKTYDLIDKYNENAGKDKDEVQNLRETLERMKLKLEEELKKLG